jgi:uncharacterized protein YbjT (DUF2867 family)
MYTILGASGQVGSAIVEQLVHKGKLVKGIARNAEKQAILRKKGAQAAIADALDIAALEIAFEDTEVLFVLTPDNIKSPDIIGDTQKILDNYRQLVQRSAIKKIVGLSSIGARHATGTGNLKMSYMLEHAFTGLPVEQVFIRPAYYLSNWMEYLPVIKENKILPSFLPVDLSLSMISPMDVAKFVADTLGKESDDSTKKIYELEGPAWYTPTDVANAFAAALNQEVMAEQIPREKWRETLQDAQFSNDAIKNFIEMTDAVIAGLAKPEENGVIKAKGKTTLQQYIDAKVKNKEKQPA